MMEREYVESSMITSIGFDSASSILEVEFKSNGQIWQYFDVPEPTYLEMKSASSLGKFFRANILRHFQESRVG
jgi:hypothetical protein